MSSLYIGRSFGRYLALARVGGHSLDRICLSVRFGSKGLARSHVDDIRT